MSRLINDSVKKQVKDAFSQLSGPVRMVYFTQSGDGCDYCADAQSLIEGVAELSDKLSVSVYDLDRDAPVARQYNVDRAPALVIAGSDGAAVQDYGIRILGIPAGYEFTSLIRDVLMVSSGDSGLSQETRDFLKNLKQPVHMQVFVTPTCPYCPRAVTLAHQMALESPMVTADMVEATEFPDLADRYGVSGVPHTTINDGAGTLVGAAPEESLVAEIQRALA